MNGNGKSITNQPDFRAVEREIVKQVNISPAFAQIIRDTLGTPVSATTLPNCTRYVWQDMNSYGKPWGGRYVVDYRVGPDGVEIQRVMADQPQTDLSGYSDDTPGVLADDIVFCMRDAIQRDLDAQALLDDEARETEYDRADRKYHDRADRDLEERR